MCVMPECYGQKIRKARKPHKCCECLGTIEKGESYHHHHGVWDGRGEDYRVCADCEALRADCDRGFSEVTPFTCLIQSVEGSWYPANSEITARFVAIKKRRGAAVPGWMEDRLKSVSV